MLRLMGYPIAIAYETYFVGRYGATLGKMVFGLKVVRSDGQSVSYGRAFGRYWANLLSSMTVTIGLHHGGIRLSKEGLARPHLRYEGDQDLETHGTRSLHRLQEAPSGLRFQH